MTPAGGSLVSQQWTEMDLTVGGQAQARAFDAAYPLTPSESNDQFLFVHGGVAKTYMPGLSTNLRITAKVGWACCHSEEGA